VSVEDHDMIDWATRERDEALRQINLFSSGVIKAILEMPDGTTQDITAGVLKHQTANVPFFERLIEALSR
jgi:hypothetical protein